jgi:hypothetical protein
MKYKFTITNQIIEIPLTTLYLLADEKGIVEINPEKIIEEAMKDYFIRGIVERVKETEKITKKVK